MLLSARDTEGDGTGMSDQQVKDEMRTLFTAAFFTTANAITWSWYLLSKSPEAEAQLHKEIDTLLGGQLPVAGDFQRLAYTTKVMTETLRVRPSSWIIARELVEPMTFAGYPVAPGSIVFTSQYVMHHDARFFPEPEKFIPDRWTPEFKKSLPALSYFPFGAGPRNCIGEPLAWMDSVIVLASIGQSWRLRPAEGKGVSYRYVFPAGIKSTVAMFRFSGGIKMVPERRAAASS